MPAALSLLEFVNDGGVSFIESSSLSPSADAQIVIILQGGSNSGWNPATDGLTVNFTTVDDGQARDKNYWQNGGTPWLGDQVDTNGSQNLVSQVATAKTTGAPGSGTVRWDFSAGITRAKMWIYESTSDFHIDSPVRQWKFGGAASGTSVTDNLDLAPLASSLLVAFGSGRAVVSTVSEDTGWSEVDEDTANNQPSNVQERTGTIATQFGINFGTDPTGGVSIGCIEIRAAADTVPEPTVEQEYQQLVTAASEYTIPESGTISPPANAWVLVPVFISDNGGTTRSVSSIISTFNVTGAGWQRRTGSVAIGNDAVLIEWWYAQCTGSPGSGVVTITFSASYAGIHGAIIFSLPSTATDDISLGSDGSVTAATLNGGVALNGTFSPSVAATSRCLAAGMGNSANNQGGVEPDTGYELVFPPTDEGNGTTTQSAHSIGDIGDSFGGLLSAAGFDHNDGVCFVAIEIQASQPALPADIPASASVTYVRR